MWPTKRNGQSVLPWSLVTWGWVAVGVALMHGPVVMGTSRGPLYSLPRVEYDWPNASMKAEYEADGRYIVENNIITGIKIHKDKIFLTVPRWKKGVPSTLNYLLVGSDITVLRPFPDWSWQTLDDCAALQYVQSMEIDPNTGYMWIVDVGRTEINENTPRNVCPPKLVIYDVEGGAEVHRYIFPDDVASRTASSLNDIVLMYSDGRATFAFIPDTYDAKLVVYDYLRDASFFYQDTDTMRPRPGHTDFTRGGNNLTISASIDGIAMTPDFRYVYYCVLSGVHLYRIPTSTLVKPGQSFRPEVVGEKAGPSDGMAFDSNGTLYFGALTSDSVYSTSYFGALRDVFDQSVFLRDPRARWVDTLAIDTDGNVWFVANNLDLFFGNSMRFVDGEDNINIWQVPIHRQGYLWKAKERTRRTSNVAVMTSQSLLLRPLLMLTVVYFYSFFNRLE